MAYDESLAERCRAMLAGEMGFSEKRMFGGLSFLIGGKMACGVLGERLVVRLDPVDADRALQKPHVTSMDFTGRPMRGFVYIAKEGLAGAALRKWVDAAVVYSRTSPTKKSAKSSTRADPVSGRRGRRGSTKTD